MALDTAGRDVRVTHDDLAHACTMASEPDEHRTPGDHPAELRAPRPTTAARRWHDHLNARATPCGAALFIRS